ncbi:putative Peroxidase 48 [Camellia sinensis]|uniref:putative Peroxidase 48 n=1 Tax=Camellia sinensis TaxID=4442 RepID=UPI0010357E4D|nr:putative Peroxidase 48 [Camellia sinensis]
MIILLELSEMDFIRKLSFLVFLLCVLISLKKENAETKKGSPTITWSSSCDSASILSYPSMSLPLFISSTEAKKFKDVDDSGSLEYDFYRESCPQAQKIIRSSVARSDVAPVPLRLVFHDCFIEGCDESVLFDAIDGVDSEKESPPNEPLKGFDLIDIIKSKLEEACPGGGGPFYLKTGRRDSNLSFSEIATYELPSPQDDLPQTITSFASRGFDERETVSLLGAHSIGTIGGKFILNRLYNFGWTDEPDPTIDIEVVNLLRSRCNNSRTSRSSSPHFVNGSPSPSPSPFLLMAQYLPHLRRQEWRWAMHHGDRVLACCTTVVFWRIEESFMLISS